MTRPGQALKAFRKKRGLTQAALGRKIGVTREYVAMLEGGVRDPSLATLRRLAKALGVSVARLIG